MVLCTTCQGFDIQTFNKKTKFTQCYELTLVAIAATDGCAFCKFIYLNRPAQLSRETGDQWIHFKMRTAEEIGYDMLPPGQGLGFTQMQVWIGSKGANHRGWHSGRYFKDFRLISRPGSAAELSGDVPRAYIGNKSDSEHHFNVLRQWLVDCQSRSHSLCNGTIARDVLIDDNYQVPLPTRLISVGYPGDKMVCLRQTTGEKGAYITLSYVRDSPVKIIPETTADNIEERQKGILVSSLPKTFQDVITITRKLNVPYVWIDALCIIQDDEGYWNREVSQMSRIYQFSLLTVAATGAEDASKGCFLNRVPTSIEVGPLVDLPYRTKEGAVSGTFSIYEQQTSFEHDYERFVENSPLLKRGWVFQERVLSRRMVHYTKGKIFFECRTTRFMDEALEGVEDQHTRIGFWGPEIKKGYKSNYTGPKTMEPGDPYLTSALGRWYMAISIYTQLHLSKKEDTLAAIAGAAKEFQLLLSLEKDNVGKPGAGRDGSPLHAPLYLSGLWSHDLLYGLSWYPTQPQKLQIAGNKPPSWSWSSWQTPIEWPGCQTFKPESKLVFLGLQNHFARSASMKLNPRERIKASALSDFEAYIPRAIASDTITTLIREIQITGKIREIWRKPHDANYLNTKEREEFLAACELNGQEKQWLTRCHALYISEEASKSAGFGCFEDYWLAKSTEALNSSEIGAELNAGLDEDEAVAMLLSLQDESPKIPEAGPSNRADDDLERAIAASLSQEAPTKNVQNANVDPDEEFNDQLAIALMLSSEEDAKSKAIEATSEASGAKDKVKAAADDFEVPKRPEEATISAGSEEEQSEDVPSSEPALARMQNKMQNRTRVKNHIPGNKVLPAEISRQRRFERNAEREKQKEKLVPPKTRTRPMRMHQIFPLRAHQPPSQAPAPQH